MWGARLPRRPLGVVAEATRQRGGEGITHHCLSFPRFAIPRALHFGVLNLRTNSVVLGLAALGLACVSSPSIKTASEKASKGEFPEASALEEMKKEAPPK